MRSPLDAPKLPGTFKAAIGPGSNGLRHKLQHVQPRLKPDARVLSVFDRLGVKVPTSLIELKGSKTQGHGSTRRLIEGFSQLMSVRGPLPISCVHQHIKQRDTLSLADIGAKFVKSRGDRESVLSTVLLAEACNAFIVSDQRANKLDRGGNQKPIGGIAALKTVKLICEGRRNVV